MSDAPVRCGRRAVFSGRVIAVDVDTVRMPGGHETALEIVRHPGGAAALALDGGRVCLLRQYRHALETWMWEAPAGRIDAGETPLETARRELAEEAGLAAKRWRSLGTLVPTPGFCDEIVHLFLAEDLVEVAAAAEPDELLQVHWLPLAEAVELVLDDRINDAKTALAILRAAPECLTARR